MYWLAVSSKDGQILTELPYIDVPKVSQTLGRYETAAATLPIAVDYAPDDWKSATKRGAAFLVLLDDNPNDPAHGIPLWGGLITKRTLSGEDTAKLSLVTAEGYLDRRYTGDKTYTAVGQNTIFQDLIQSYVAVGSNGGIPIRVAIVNGGAGQVRDRSYFDKDDKTIYSTITDLAGVDGGFEWTIGWEWQSSPERLTMVAYVGDRIGSAVLPGLAPAAVFEMPGAVSSFSIVEDYAAGRGANDVMASSSGEGDTRPQSPRQVFADPDLPTFEYRWTPSTSITSIDTLTSHAERALTVLKDGSTALSLSAAVAGAPRLGVDWALGDDAGYDVGAPDYLGRDTVPAFPGGITGTARVGGWSLDLQPTSMVTPVLVGTDGDF